MLCAEYGGPGQNFTLYRTLEPFDTDTPAQRYGISIGLSDGACVRAFVRPCAANGAFKHSIQATRHHISK
eukprot:SAG11_NODE_53_length_19648_cov_14.691902_24_plen_70_part_00